MSAPMLELSPLGVGAVLRLERDRDEWSNDWGKQQMSSPPPLPATPLGHYNSHPLMWASRLKLLRNKCYSSFCLVNSFSHHIVPTKPVIFPRLCQEPRWASHVSIQFSSDFFGTMRWSYCYYGCFKWVTFTGSWPWDIPFFIFMGKTVSIGPATSLFLISRPADDGIARKDQID